MLGIYQYSERRHLEINQVSLTPTSLGSIAPLVPGQIVWIYILKEVIGVNVGNNGNNNYISECRRHCAAVYADHCIQPIRFAIQYLLGAQTSHQTEQHNTKYHF